MKTKLFCALDFESADRARSAFQLLRPHHDHFKIGLELFTAAGPGFVRELTEQGAKIFLDLKFHDIPNTVAGAVRQVAGLGAGWINVHLMGGEAMVAAAREAIDSSAPAGQRPPVLLGVTVLTSVDDAGLRSIHVKNSAADQVLALATQGKAWGVDGVVCSAMELPALRKNLPSDFVTVVPGIRPAGAAAGDQSRVAAPGDAAKAGADFIVVGRPIFSAPDPVAALQSVLGEL